MRFLVLGPVGVLVDGRRVPLARGQQRTILAVLLAGGGEVVTSDRLVDALWDSDPPATARKSLQSHTSRLRHQLTELAPDTQAPIQSAPNGYRLDLTGHEVDAHQFRTLVQQAHQSTDPREALTLFENAEACWHGPAYGDLASHPALTAAARDLDLQRAAAAADRIDVLLALGRHDEVVNALPRVIADEPYDERAHGQLMRALVAAGRRGDALSLFHDLQARLRDELGIDPSPELRGLHEEILRQDSVTPMASPPPTTAPPPPTSARRTDPLLGRERDLSELSTSLQKASVITLTGPGGIGKTSLAEHLVERTRDQWRDSVMCCALANVRDADGVGGALITALAIQPSGEQTVTDALVSGLGDRHLLLLLDNCEHVLDAVTPYIDAIVTGCPNVTVLATSRERLRLPSERVWPVSPLDVPPTGSAASGVLDTSAGNLFRLRAQAAEPSFELTDNNAGAVAELCRRLDGMPLAIELAAARTRALSPAALVERLDQRFAVLAGGPRHEGGRHRTLEAVVAWSYDLLEPAEADLFDRLAVFAGAVPLATIEAVCTDHDLPQGEIAGLLGELVDKSMVVVQRDGDDIRYHLLDTMRDFGLHRLEERGLTDAMRRSHAEHHTALAEDMGARSHGPEEPVAAATISRAMDDLRAAHAWAVASDDPDIALRLPAALPDEVAFRLRDEVTTWARRAVAMPGARTHPSYAAALATAAWGATSRDECERAVDEATASLEMAQPDGSAALVALATLMTAAVYEGRLEDVLDLADRQEEPAAALGDDFRLSFVWVCRVLGHLYRGEIDAATAGVPEVRRIAERSGSPTMRAFSRYCDGEVHLERDPDHAATALKEAVDLARSVGSRLIEGVSLVCLASSQGRHGQVDDALRAFRDVVVHWRTVGDHTHQLTAVRNLVELLAEAKADEPAAILYGAVTSADTPTYGIEAVRLAQAWKKVEGRLGRDAAETLAEQGKTIGVRQIGDAALAQLDTLLES